VNNHSLWLILKYYQGGDVGAVLESLQANGEELPQPRALSWVSQLLLAVEFVHACRLIHRDIKPPNLFITGTKVQHVCLGDFGVSKQLDMTDRAYTNVGSPMYMAPECFEGGGVTSASDLWSVGVVMFELLSGRRPWEAGNILALAAKIGQEPRAPLDVDADLCALVDSMLTTIPEHRNTASDVLKHPRILLHVELFKRYGPGLERVQDNLLHARFQAEDEGHQQEAPAVVGPAASTGRAAVHDVTSTPERRPAAPASLVHDISVDDAQVPFYSDWSDSCSPARSPAGGLECVGSAAPRERRFDTVGQSPQGTQRPHDLVVAADESCSIGAALRGALQGNRAGDSQAEDTWSDSDWGDARAIRSVDFPPSPVGVSPHQPGLESQPEGVSESDSDTDESSADEQETDSGVEDEEQSIAHDQPEECDDGDEEDEDEDEDGDVGEARFMLPVTTHLTALMHLEALPVLQCSRPNSSRPVSRGLSPVPRIRPTSREWSQRGLRH